MVLSADFNPGAVLDGVSFTNPLDPAFDVAVLELAPIGGQLFAHGISQRD